MTVAIKPTSGAKRAVYRHRVGSARASKPRVARYQVVRMLPEVTSNFAAAIARLRRDQPAQVVEDTTTFLRAVEALGLTATEIARSPEGGVTVSFGAVRSKFAFIELYHDGVIASVLKEFGGRPDVNEQASTPKTLREIAQRVAEFLGEPSIEFVISE